MSAPYADGAAAAMSVIQGSRDAQRLVATIREGCAPADALHEGLDQVRGLADGDRLRGFCRELQKSLERA